MWVNLTDQPRLLKMRNQKEESKQLRKCSTNRHGFTLPTVTPFTSPTSSWPPLLLYKPEVVEALLPITWSGFLFCVRNQFFGAASLVSPWMFLICHGHVFHDLDFVKWMVNPNHLNICSQIHRVPCHPQRPRVIAFPSRGAWRRSPFQRTSLQAPKKCPSLWRISAAKSRKRPALAGAVFVNCKSKCTSHFELRLGHHSR